MKTEGNNKSHNYLCLMILDKLYYILYFINLVVLETSIHLLNTYLLFLPQLYMNIL